MSEKEQIKRLIDELPESTSGELMNFVSFLRLKDARHSYETAVLSSLPSDEEPYQD